MTAAAFVYGFVSVVVGADPAIRPDQPYAVTFAAQRARFVRLVVQDSFRGEPCIDELEVYGPGGKSNLALADGGAKATASSCLPGHPQHKIEHLNDGRYGNDFSWIPAGKSGQWAQIELPRAAEVAKVVISRDRTRHYADRVLTRFEVRLSLDGRQWTTVKSVSARPVAVSVRRGRIGPVGFVPPPPPPPASPAGAGRVGPAEQPGPGRPLPTVPRRNRAGFDNLALRAGAKAAASSLLPGYQIHQIHHLNDGQAGNGHSWVAAANPCWAEIDLGEQFWVYCVAFGSDSSGRYLDRAATSFSILTATEYDPQSAAKGWRTVYKRLDGPPVRVRTEFRFRPVRARWVRVVIESADRNSARIDELEVYGQKGPIPVQKIGPLPPPELAASGPAMSRAQADQLLRYAFLAEEHAWLKTYGRADLSSRLVPYNGRVKVYPRHVGPDRLPLPPLPAAADLDGQLADPCWQRASRGVVRVAYPYDFDHGPLVETAVWAGHRDGHLYLGIETDRLLSSHLAIVSSGDGTGTGVLKWQPDGLVFNTYEPDGKLKESRPVEGRWDRSLRCFELRLPLKWFPDCRVQGLRVGLGMGGKHTKAEGRPVHFSFAPLAVAELPPCVAGRFRVRLTAAADGPGATVTGNVPALADGLHLSPGQSRLLAVSGHGPIGPQFDLTIDHHGRHYALHLFRYDPLERTLTLMEQMIDRFAAQGREVGRERKELAGFGRRHQQLLAAAKPDRAAERAAFFQARLAKRRLFFREPDLEPIGHILFVKRHAFEPSHNYSVLLDAPWRPGGGVFLLHIPRRRGRFVPAEAELTRLFDSGSGIARNPAANFDLTKVYFGYRPSRDGYFHIMEMNPDGSGLKQLTSGPFHDYWPCPLPDGGLAFISTRCRARYLCWRPQVAVLFRMDADGSHIRPLSFANLTEWGPSVMRDGRIIWQRSEYQDKGADFGHTLWAIRPDGTRPELVFGNDIIQPNGYANGREVPGTPEVLCTLISHFGDLNGPLALVNPARGRFTDQAITTLTPEVPWPGMWPKQECFRDPFPLARDYFLCSHAPRGQFGLYVIDRYGNRELLYLDRRIGSMCPTPFRRQPVPPVISDRLQRSGDRSAAAVELARPPEAPHRPETNSRSVPAHAAALHDRPGAPDGQPAPTGGRAELILLDVYQGIEHRVKRGRVKYLRVCQELRADLQRLPDGSYRSDHPDFLDWYATPVHKVSGPFGWPTYVAKAVWGIVPVEEDGSARFYVPAGKVLYFEALDEEFNELQRMRSVVQLQPGERRSCVGCHEPRHQSPPNRPPLALRRPARRLEPPPWGPGPFAYERVVQPVWNRHCVRCHNASDPRRINFAATLDKEKVPASYRTLIEGGWVHYLDCQWNRGGTEKREPLTFGTVKSRLWQVLEPQHYGVKLTAEEKRRIKCWTDLNCPLWPDYLHRPDRPALAVTDRTGPGRTSLPP